MFESVHNIIVKGGHFTSRTSLNNVLDKRINVLFGRNGSGKSTIARALAELADPSRPAEEKAFEKIELDRVLSDDEKRAIHVFNEDFIDRYVKLQDDALGPIVMLGNQVGIASKIADKEKEINGLQREYDSLKIIFDELNDERKNISPTFCFKVLKTALTAPGKWAERDSHCKVIASRRNSPVTEDTIKRLYDVLNTNPLTEDEYNEQNKAFEHEYALFIQSAGKSIVGFEDSTISNPLDVDALQSLLVKHIQKPELNERERELIRIVENQIDRLTDVRSVFSDYTVDVCPFCFRDISRDEKTSLCTNIEHILNHEVEDYKASVREFQMQMNEHPYKYASLEALFKDECKSVKLAIAAYNQVLNQCKMIVAERVDHLFEPFERDIRTLDLAARISDVNSAIRKLSEVVKTYNDSITERNRKAADLSCRNDRLTAHRYSQGIRNYITANNNLCSNTEQLQAKDLELEKAKLDLMTLNQSLEETHTALDFINDCLAYIYFSKTRLVLEVNDKSYRLKSYGEIVKPGNVSVGERNIIGLCYYFAHLFDHIKQEDQYKNEMLLVIDDPISSFDVENKMGVMSFLRWQIGKVYKGNPKSKVLIMSHDLKTVYDIQKLVLELTGKEHNYNELRNKEIIPRKSSSGNVYEWMFTSVYEYAISSNPEQNVLYHTIGNIMRRLLEAFFSFNYQIAFYKFVFTDEFLNQLPEEKRHYYGNLMTRLVLNGGSHEEETIKALGDLFGLFTPEETQITAKSILSMIFLLNRLHVKLYLGEDAVKKLEEWQASGFDVVTNKK